MNALYLFVFAPVLLLIYMAVKIYKPKKKLFVGGRIGPIESASLVGINTLPKGHPVTLEFDRKIGEVVSQEGNKVIVQITDEEVFDKIKNEHFKPTFSIGYSFEAKEAAK